MTFFNLSNCFKTAHKKLTQTLSLYRLWWKDISIGLFMRISLLIVIFIAAMIIPLPDMNDMNQLLTQGLSYMFQGLNPYNRLYTLSAYGDIPQVIYSQNFMNYGPLNLLIHLPCMIYPWSFYGAGFIDIQPSFTLLHCFFDFLMFDRLMRMDHRRGAWAAWVNPIMLSLNFVTFLSVPLFFILMAYEKWEDPFQSVFWLGLGTITYQFIGLFLLFALAYHLRSYRKVLQALSPAILVLGAFQAWALLEGRPWALFHDLLLVQFNRPYEPWSSHSIFWYPWTGSLPAVLFNIFGTDFVSVWTGGLLRLSTLMSAIALVVAAALMIHLALKPEYLRALVYSSGAMALFLFGSPAGLWHHMIMVFIPVTFMIIEVDRHYRRKQQTSLSHAK